MDMHWTIYQQRDGGDEKVPLARFQRPLEGAAPADFGLSMSEAGSLLSSLQDGTGYDSSGNAHPTQNPGWMNC
jgi:hypothetical protein